MFGALLRHLEQPVEHSLVNQGSRVIGRSNAVGVTLDPHADQAHIDGEANSIF